MLQPGNTKLGNMHAFSIPAIDTCPGRTELCQALCYASRYRFKQENVRASLQANWEATSSTSFVKDMIAEIREKRCKIVRIHVAGDFYNLPYIRKWIKIIEACPDVIFYAYTRSWRVKRLLPGLLDMNALPNVYLWWSVDKETRDVDGAPPEADNVRVAYMATDYDEPIPPYVDLVFRTKRRKAQKFRDGILVCPAENGVPLPKGVKHQCSRCRLCLSDKRIPRKELGSVKDQLAIVAVA